MPCATRHAADRRLDLAAVAVGRSAEGDRTEQRDIAVERGEHAARRLWVRTLRNPPLPSGGAPLARIVAAALTITGPDASSVIVAARLAGFAVGIRAAVGDEIGVHGERAAEGGAREHAVAGAEVDAAAFAVAETADVDLPLHLEIAAGDERHDPAVVSVGDRADRRRLMIVVAARRSIVPPKPGVGVCEQLAAGLEADAACGEEADHAGGHRGDVDRLSDHEVAAAARAAGSGRGELDAEGAVGDDRLVHHDRLGADDELAAGDREGAVEGDRPVAEVEHAAFDARGAGGGTVDGLRGDRARGRADGTHQVGVYLRRGVLADPDLIAAETCPPNARYEEQARYQRDRGRRRGAQRAHGTDRIYGAAASVRKSHLACEALSGCCSASMRASRSFVGAWVSARQLSRPHAHPAHGLHAQGSRVRSDELASRHPTPPAPAVAR